MSRPERQTPALSPGLYIHVPFCSAICPYCDFAVLTGGAAARRGFVASLLAEIELWRREAASWQTFDTIYFGGGTPSALALEQLEQVLEAVRRAFAVSAAPWIGLEANPEDVSGDSVAAWRSLGITMLSLGVQSFDEAALRFFGRRHGPAAAVRSVEVALAADFPAVSIDLMYGEPAARRRAGAPQAVPPATADPAVPAERWRRDLEQAVALGPQHISCYQLTVHEGTAFGFRAARGELSELGEEEQAGLFQLTHDVLAAAGYEGYEVSNFAHRPEHQSRHNRKYWNHTPYLGLGPSAHSFDGRRRWWNERKLRPWQERLATGKRPIAGSETLTPSELALEELMFAFRTRDGLDLEGFRRRHGIDLGAANRSLIEALENDGRIVRRAERLEPTVPGMAIADALARSFQLA